MYSPHWLALLAEAQIRNGLIGEARDGIEKAVEISGRYGKRFFLAELHRLRGELRLVGDADASAHGLAEADFELAQEIAERQCARLLYLRAATSRARLWLSLGRHADALALLDRARAGLVEGSHLSDAQDAAALLI